MDILDLKEFIKDSLDYFITFLIIFLVVIYILGFSRVIGCSMEPSLYNGDIVVTSNSHYNFFNFKRGDVISFSFGEIILIKRVVGLPGDKVIIDNGIVYVNDKKISDEKNIPEIDYSDNFSIVPENHLFVLGDNMPKSFDSREGGFIPFEDVESKVMFRIFPFHKFSLI